MSGHLGFSAVVGLDDAKLALLLATVDIRIGGVLLTGDKGSAKTTLARGLAALLPEGAPFVELPLGATEDRVVGSLDLTALLNGGAAQLQRGLLAAAHGGVLYVDEINLLADHLVDVLLDVAVSGINRVERDGVSVTHPARFVLIGSMNPEEGDLRPQLLDRFGLSVAVRAPQAIDDRAAAVHAQLLREAAVDGDPATAPDLADHDLAVRLGQLPPIVPVPDVIVRAAAALAVAVDAQGLRADLTLCRAARAHARWQDRTEPTVEDLRLVAPLVLAHRRRRDPFDQHHDGDDLDDAIDRTLGEHEQPPGPFDHPPAGDAPADDEPGGGVPSGGDHEQPPAANGAELRSALADQRSRTRSTSSGRRDVASGQTGRYVRDVAATTATTRVAAVPTATRLAVRRAAAPHAATQLTDVREAVSERKVGATIVVAVDASGSMGAGDRIAAAKGAVLGLLRDAYVRRDKVALVTFRGERADVALRPTSSVEIARTRLDALATGGATPLAEGIRAAAELAAREAARNGGDALVVLITDGRATAGGEARSRAEAEAAELHRRRIRAVVVDAETSLPRLGLAAELAARAGATLVHLDSLGPVGLEAAIRHELPA